MLSILYKTLVLIMIIVLGYLTKRLGLFTRDGAFPTISALVMNVTLPAAIVINLNGLDFPLYFLLIGLIGFLANWVYLLVSKVVGKNDKEQQFMMININSYNIGNFSFPFISYFLEGLPILALSLFDSGSAVMGMGVNYAVARNVTENKTKTSLVDLIKPIFKSVAIWTYLIMIPLSMLGLKLPTIFTDIIALPAAANPFLSLFMIGLVLELEIDEGKGMKIIKYLSIRYGVATLLAMGVYFLPFFPLEIKQALILVLFSPITSVAPVFTSRLNGDLKLSGQINSLSIIISTIVLTILLVLMIG